MKINDAHRLENEAGDQLLFPNLGGGIPNDSPKVQAAERIIVIHAPASGSLSGAVANYRVKADKNGGPRRSMHFFLDSDGRSVAQPLVFNTSANHTLNQNGRSIGIQLIYPGQLTDKKAPPFDPQNVFPDNKYVLASSINSSSYTCWPLFPDQQLETLLKVCSALTKKYTITDVVAADELSTANHPGPAFPIALFREKLLGVTERSFILQELTQPVSLLGQPNNKTSALFPDQLPAGTRVSILNEKGNWYLVSEITPQGSSWKIGWVKKDAVRVITDFIPVVRSDEHVMRTQEGRRLQHIEPHTNGYDQGKSNPQPLFIIMHFTTGTKMESTISTFKNPSSGVSTHLLIGRDGRVVQFLPFDAIAHHSGYSWWERRSNLNTMSIGIEMDNAGILIRNKDGVWTRRGMTFSSAQVGRKYHEKQYRSKKRDRTPGWEKFPQQQLDVALNIVKALKERYPSIIEILGHDTVNLRNRYDPGPLFPMEEFRLALFGRKDPVIKEYTINHPTEELYANYRGMTPNTKQGAFKTPLPAKSTVKVLKEDEDYVLVTVLSTKKPDTKVTGWIQKDSLSDPEPKFLKLLKKLLVKGKGQKGDRIPDRRTTTIEQPIFKRGEGTPTPPMKEGNLFGKKVRIQMVRGEWTLVVFLKKLNGRGGVEGWIRTEYLTPDVDF